MMTRHTTDWGHLTQLNSPFRAILCSVRGKVRIHETFEQAVSVSRQIAKKSEVRSDVALLQGREVKAAHWSDECLGILLSGGVGLKVVATQPFPSWSVIGESEFASLAACCGDDDQAISVVVRLPGTEVTNEFSRANLISKRIGKRIARVFTSSVGAVSVMFESDASYLFFETSLIIPSQDPLLVWCEESE